MSVLTWGNIGERFYETGVDRGVLFPKIGDGVPWNGLISVSESPSGGEPRPYYYNGFKYLNLSTSEEFEASIDAYSAPEEFAKCDGIGSIHNGLFITQQPRESFGLSYRTLIGDDIIGTDLGYKIHLIYNALASPSSRSNASLNDSPTPMALSWNITTAPPPITGFKSSAHFVVDSRKTPASVLSLIEGVLYGTPSSSPRMPSVSELLDLFEQFVMLRTELVEAGVYSIYEVDQISDSTATMGPTLPFVSSGGTPILWLDTSVPGYSTLKIVTGD